MHNQYQVLNQVCIECNTLLEANQCECPENEISDSLTANPEINASGCREKLLATEFVTDHFTHNVRNDQNHVPLHSQTDVHGHITKTAKDTLFKFNSRGVHIVNLNIRHLKPKLDEIKIMLQQSNNIDIFAACETFLDQTVDNETISINGYMLERKDRGESNQSIVQKGGGIVIYVNNNLQYDRRNDIETHDIESIWIEIKLKNSKPFLVCSVYRPPSSTSVWFDSFSKEIEKAFSFSDEVYIMGDINIDFKNNELQNSTWKHTIELHDLHQLIETPTRITARSETLIDHLYASNTDLVTDITVPEVAISDHYPICFTRCTSKNQFKRHTHKTIQYRCYTKFNEELFHRDLSHAMDSFDVYLDNTNSNFENWSSRFMQIFNQHAPLRTKRVKRETQPEWHNDEIKQAMKRRDFYHKAKHWKEYKIWRNKIASLIRTSKKDFFTRSVEENKACSFLWKHVKDLKNESNETSLPQDLIIDDTKVDDSNDIANKLNYYFTSISERLTQEQNQQNIPFDVTKLNEYISNKIPNNISFSIPLMKYHELIAILTSLDVSKATGLDGITAKVLKSAAQVVCPTLLNIINISITTGVFPNSLKFAKILPIHKGGSKSDPSNYRPIAILSILSKIIEKHVTKHLFGYMNKYNVLHKSQSGFRKNHSCNTALVNLVDRWLSNIDKGEINGAVFFDLRKAFDIVDHTILISKLAAYKFDQASLTWVQSYLTERKQCIVNGSIRSPMLSNNSGVPQGSVLGPVLFLLFVNDLPLFVNGTYLDLYADDATMHTSSKATTIVENKLQSGAQDFKHWCILHKMFVHTGKTSAMLIGSRNKLANSETLQIYIDNELIKNVDTQKLLGITIDNTLNWESQINRVCQNITKKITLMKLLSKYIDQQGLKQYYKSYILPIFDYGCMVWGHCSATSLNRLLKLQKRAARIVLKVDIMTPSETMFRELNWLPFYKRVQYHEFILMYKTLNNLAPDYLSERFIKVSETHDRKLRSVENDLLNVPYSRTRYYDNAFSVAGAKLWNSLPNDIRQSPSLCSFKTRIKSYLHTVIT